MASAGGRDCCVMQWRLHLARTSDEDLDDFGFDRVYGRAFDRSLFQLTGDAERERDACACIRRHQAFALAPVRARRFRAYLEAPGFRTAPHNRNRSLFLLNISRFIPDPTSPATVLQVSWTGNECKATINPKL